jgi:IS30 family transposase
MNKHNKITALERDQIAWWLACGITIREMARRLGRSPSSISEELKRNKTDGVYGSIKAHQTACAAFGGLCRGKATSGVVRGNKKLVLLIDGVMAAHIIINSY